MKRGEAVAKMGHEQVLANGQVCQQTLHFASLTKTKNESLRGKFHS